MKINPEIMSNNATHQYNDMLVKVYSSTQRGNKASGEIMSGEHKGKLTTVDLSKATKLENNNE